MGRIPDDSFHLLTCILVDAFEESDASAIDITEEKHHPRKFLVMIPGEDDQEVSVYAWYLVPDKETKANSPDLSFTPRYPPTGRAISADPIEGFRSFLDNKIQLPFDKNHGQTPRTSSGHGSCERFPNRSDLSPYTEETCP